MCRLCYFTSNRKQDFMRELSYRSACLQCSLSDKEISEYIQEKKQKAGDIPLKAAVAYVGRQLDGTWVLGEGCCISEGGAAISMEDSRYVWIGNMYKGVGVASTSLQCKVELPLTAVPLMVLFDTLRSSMQHNYIPCLLVIAGRYE